MTDLASRPAIGASTRGSVLLTRPARRSDALAERLRAAGIAVHVVPTVTTEPIPAGLEAAIGILGRSGPGSMDWVVATSPIGASLVVTALAGARLSAVRGRPRLAAVGPATEAVLREGGWTAAAVPTQPRGVNVADAIAAAERLAGRRVLLLRADAAGADLPDALRAAGAIVEEVAVYRTVEAPGSSSAPLRAALRDPALALVVVASGSAVRGLVRLAGPELSARLAEIPIASIGPTTSASVRAAGLQAAAEAGRPDDDALFDLIDPLLPPTDRSHDP